MTKNKTNNRLQNLKKIGSSETTRETSLIKFNFSDYIRSGSPEHKPNPDLNFLEWFLGFFEAEGSFLKWSNSNKTDRFGIEITQKDAQLINKIRSFIGFGKVTKIEKKSETYWRFYIQQRVNLERIILLFNGNFITVKKQNQFTIWLDAFNKRHNTEILLLRSEVKLSLETGWLSGFLEGDGGFYVRDKVVRINKKDQARKFDIKMKFYITQKDEDQLFEQIRSLLNIPTKVYTVTNGHSKVKYNRLETHVFKCHALLRDYLQKYPFLGKRKIALTQWDRLLNYRTADYPVTDKSVKKAERLVASLNGFAKNK